MLGELVEGDVAVEGALEQGADRRGLEEDVRLVLGVQVAVAKRLDVQVAGEALVERHSAAAGSAGAAARRLRGRRSRPGAARRARGTGSRRGRSRVARSRPGTPRAPRRAPRGRRSARRCGRARASRRPASAASSAAWRAVEWPVSAARSASSSAKLASWTSSWASCAATRVISQGAVSPLITSLRPARASPITWLGVDRRRRVPLDRLAVLEPLEVGARRDAEPLRRPRGRSARALVLDQRVAVGAHPVLDLERAHLVAVVAHRLARIELDQVDLVAEPAEDPPQRLEQLEQAGRADHPQRRARGRSGRRSSAAPGCPR